MLDKAGGAFAAHSGWKTRLRREETKISEPDKNAKCLQCLLDFTSDRVTKKTQEIALRADGVRPRPQISVFLSPPPGKLSDRIPWQLRG